MCMEMGEDDPCGMPDLGPLQYLTAKHAPQVYNPTFRGGGAGGFGSHQQQAVFPRGGFVEFYGFGGGAYAFNNDSDRAALGPGLLYGGESKVELKNMCSNNGGSRRWARQETLTLLEVRSRLDPRFKEATHKGHLWDEVSRIMAEEHGYTRSGKKCREKFENLYKYYKKTKDSKAARPDGKHYRFFHQLESIYGESSHQPPHSQETRQGNQERANTGFSGTYASEFDQGLPNLENHNEDSLTSVIASTVKGKRERIRPGVEGLFQYSENNKEDGLVGEWAETKARQNVETMKGWKVKVKEFVDSEMRKVVRSQELWMERTMKAIEEREHRRLVEEQEKRNKEAVRWSQEREVWARERALIEEQDNELMKVLEKFLRERRAGESSSRLAKEEADIRG